MNNLREIMALATRPGVLSFAIGLPAAELFPREELAGVAARVLRTEPSALQYGLPLQPLKAQIVEMMAWRGVRCTEEQIFLTSGSQQGMDLLSRLLLPQGGQVLFDEAVYDGIRLATRLQQPEILTVASDPATGMDVDAVEALLAGGARPAFLYAIPDGHNPLGVSLSREKRHRLAALARRYRMPILEDDAYGFLYYGEEPAPPLRALEEEWVYYLGSFSKILAPGLRVGWVVVPPPVAARLSPLKHGADIDTPSLSHWVVSAYLESGSLPAHLTTLREEYRRRRDTMLAALREHFPSGVRWSHPGSGMFVWAELPPGLDAVDLLRAAVETERVAFSPGAIFYGGALQGARYMRLNFTSLPPERIEEGLRRLGRAIRALQEKPGAELASPPRLS
ncbi:MAG TPA: PLP-dependent aminotransferase family protein [Thermoanaerobaculia bacterium]